MSEVDPEVPRYFKTQHLVMFAFVSLIIGLLIGWGVVSYQKGEEITGLQGKVASLKAEADMVPVLGKKLTDVKNSAEENIKRAKAEGMEEGKKLCHTPAPTPVVSTPAPACPVTAPTPAPRRNTARPAPVARQNFDSTPTAAPAPAPSQPNTTNGHPWRFRFENSSASNQMPCASEVAFTNQPEFCSRVDIVLAKDGESMESWRQRVASGYKLNPNTARKY